MFYEYQMYLDSLVLLVLFQVIIKDLANNFRLAQLINWISFYLSISRDGSLIKGE